MRALLNSMMGMTLVASLISFVIIGGYYTLRHHGKPLNWPRIIALALFAGYMTGLFSLTLELAYVMDNGLHLDLNDLNLVPFLEIKRFFGIIESRTGMINLLGNILIFIPVGFFVSLLLRGKFPLLRGLLWSLLISVFIECFQLLTPRTTDIDDIILNTLGGLLGVFLYLIFRKIFPRFSGRLKQPTVKRAA